MSSSKETIMATRRKLPHEGVFTELLPSKITPARVGVFAILPIEKDADPFPADKEKLRWVSESKIRMHKLPGAVYALYEYFGALCGTRRYAPENFSRMGQSWYVCNSPTPNLYYGEDDRFHANRYISPCEELTVDFDTIG